MYDAIIIGARCAGSPTAMHLARRGYRVLLTDKAIFPSDTMSTHIVWQSALARLQRWGLLERTRALGAPPIYRMRGDLGGVKIEGSPSPMDGVVEFYAPRRTVLDRMLAEEAAAAGAELREGFLVSELTTDGADITGIRGRTRGGANVEERARIVIGADGRHSLVAHTVKAVQYDVRPANCTCYYAYWSGVGAEAVELTMRDGAAYGWIPTNDGLTVVAAFWSEDAYPGSRTAPEQTYHRILRSDAAVAERVYAGRIESPVTGTFDEPAFFRKPYGPGWALVGDAGYHKHPITAQGIPDAFRDAESLAGALDESLGGGAPPEETLARYEAQRNEAAGPMYEFTFQRASLKPPPPEIAQLIAALPGNQEQIDRFLGLDAGTVSIAEFFSPENVERILGRRSKP